MMNQRWSKSKVAATAILGLCLVAFVTLDEQSYTSQYLYDGRRSLEVVNRFNRKLRRQNNNLRLKNNLRLRTQRRVQRFQKKNEAIDRLTRTSDGFNKNSNDETLDMDIDTKYEETLDMNIDTKSDDEPSLQERLANMDILLTRTSAAFSFHSSSFNDEQDVEEKEESSLDPLSATPEPDLGTALFWNIPEVSWYTIVFQRWYTWVRSVYVQYLNFNAMQ